MRVVDLVGKKFNFLLVVSRAENSANGQARWNCVCDCGGVNVVRAGNLKNDLVISCGCKSSRLNKKTHGMTGTPTYNSWGGMIQRCTNPNSKSFPEYGGRGITVCERWIEFERFLEDMGEKLSGTSIDRIDNSKGYFPENCRWATNKQQARNTRKNLVLTMNGKSQCFSAWVEELNLNPDKFRYMLRLGSNVTEAANHAR